MTSFFVFVTLSSKKDGVPNFFGYSLQAVLSNSMKGSKSDDFQKGDLIAIGSIDKSKLKVGDVVTFWTIIEGSKVLNSHRINSIDTSGSTTRYITKGDNNPTVDSETITSNDIVGIYKFQIKGAGNIMEFLGSKWGFLFCMVLPLFLFFVWRLIKLVMAVVDYRKAQIDEKASVKPEE